MRELPAAALSEFEPLPLLPGGGQSGLAQGGAGAGVGRRQFHPNLPHDFACFASAAFIAHLQSSSSFPFFRRQFFCLNVLPLILPPTRPLF